jgi:hypothetical protein
MNSHYTKRQVFISAHFEAGRLHAQHKLVLARKLANAFDEVLVGMTVLGDQLTLQRDYIEGVGVVELADQWIVNMGKFETQKTTTCSCIFQKKSSLRLQVEITIV